jgi:hypothetical protein
VDQFEQVFTQCADESERHAFVTALHAAATVGHGPRQVPAAAVVLVVRADFEAQCVDYEELATASTLPTSSGPAASRAASPRAPTALTRA